jgi:hypothetical protein
LPVSVIAVCVLSLWAADKTNKDTPAAATTRTKKLQAKITLDYKDEHLRVVLDEINSQLEAAGLDKIAWKFDTGVSKNQRVSFKGKDKTVAEALDGLFKANGLGYVVISKAKDNFDGGILIKQGKERGYLAGQQPDETAPPKDGTTPKDKDKSVGKDKPAGKDKPDDDPDKAEQLALKKLNLAKILAEDGKVDKAKERLRDLIKDYPKTKAAERARQLLEKLNK